jgi:hypothetical protein
MKARYRLIRRGIRNGYYCVDTQTRKRTSLGTNDEDSARQVVEAKNLAERQPMLNRQIAKAYARKAQVTLSPLEEYEAKIVQFSAAQAAAVQVEPAETGNAVNG